jgi:hypothetical protein
MMYEVLPGMMRTVASVLFGSDATIAGKPCTTKCSPKRMIFQKPPLFCDNRLSIGASGSE